MQRRWAPYAVFLGSFLVLAAGANSPGLATAYADPISKIHAQDEAVYAATSLGMARGDGWITPKFLGRYALYKPPLLYWLSAASVRLFGESAFALRLPSLFAGAATVTLVFLWLSAQVSLAAALTGALLVISNHIFFVLARVALTDSLLTLEITLAAFVVSLRPRLDSRASLWTFALASGFAIMTKAIAGVLPWLAWLLLCLLTGQRPSGKRLMQAAAIAAAVALPWHLWQLWRHPHWFWAEYVLTEHLDWGLGRNSPGGAESPAIFYARRLLLTSPVLAIAAILAAVFRHPRAIVAFLAILAAALLAFQYRNAAYLMTAIPFMALAAALAIPPRFAPAALAAALALFAMKAMAPSRPWGIPFGAESVNLSQIVLDDYASIRRPHELFIGQPDDQFYSATLALPRVRYVYVDAGARRRFPLDFEYLGVTVTAADFARLDRLRPVFAHRLKQFDLPSSDPIATVIIARDDREVANLLASRPNADFYIPADWVPLDQDTHDPHAGPHGRVFLLARD
jgi:hypothetical protein